MPIVADVLKLNPYGSGISVDISPLKSLMDNQVNLLNNIGVPAIAIRDIDDPEIIQQVMNENYVVMQIKNSKKNLLELLLMKLIALPNDRFLHLLN